VSAISLPAAPPILVPMTMLPTIVAAGPGSVDTHTKHYYENLRKARM
jgi:hypothetical protein